MTGVLCQMAGNEITFVATDAHKLVRYRRKDVPSESESSFIIPKKALTLLKNTLPDDDTPIEIDYNPSNAFFRFGQIHLICRLIDEKYPDYEAVIPRSEEHTSELQSLMRISYAVFCLKKKRYHIIKIQFNKM